MKQHEGSADKMMHSEVWAHINATQVVRHLFTSWILALVFVAALIRVYVLPFFRFAVLFELN